VFLLLVLEDIVGCFWVTSSLIDSMVSFILFARIVCFCLSALLCGKVSPGCSFVHDCGALEFAHLVN
jgi:hypothetical protein